MTVRSSPPSVNFVSEFANCPRQEPVTLSEDSSEDASNVLQTFLPVRPCADDEVCSRVSQSCDSCASNFCAKTATSGSTTTIRNGGDGGGANVGAIAGGVVGGVFFIAIVTYLVWRFWVKGRRQEYDQAYVEDEDNPSEKDPDAFSRRRDARASTHTVGSMASTVFTRASNVIQIAYIPGVTNRNTQHPSTPPVPPIPAAGSDPGGPHANQDLIFVPGDLRGSTYTTAPDTRASICDEFGTQQRQHDRVPGRRRHGSDARSNHRARQSRRGERQVESGWHPAGDAR